MIVTIHQPGYLPWHGLFHRMALCDLHIFLDSAQFEKNGFNNRVKVGTPQGAQWLTVPVRTKGRFQNNPLCRAQIDNTQDWRRAHWKTLCIHYGRAPFFQDYQLFFQELYDRQWELLADLNIHAVEYLARDMGIGCRFVRASERSVSGTKGDWVINLCKLVGATVYISGIHGRNYLDRAAFAREGIALRFQDYREPRYRQLYPGFEPFLSVVDLLLNHGGNSREILIHGQDSLETGTREQ
jgi:hypothetical protein